MLEWAIVALLAIFGSVGAWGALAWLIQGWTG